MQSEIVRRIIMARHELGLSQQNVADELGVAVSTYSKVERGQTNIKMTRLEQIAKILKKDVSELLGFQKEGGANTTEPPLVYQNNLTQQVLLLSNQLNAVQYKLGQLENDVRRLESKI